MKKTIQQWLETIADDTVRKAALNNMLPTHAGYSAKGLEDAILGAFDWEKTSEGFLYWEEIHSAAYNQTLKLNQ